MRRLVPFACLLLPIALAAQTPPSTSNAEAKAEAKASSNSSDSKSKKSSSSQTVTHRVVVVNGKTIVDEKKVDNKPALGGRKPAGLGLGGTPTIDIEAMKQEMMRKLRKQLKKDMGGSTIRPPLRIGGKNLTPDAQKGMLRDLLREVQSKQKAGTKMPAAKKPTRAKAPRGKLVPRTRKARNRTRPIR
jgi:hypothetical protein